MLGEEQEALSLYLRALEIREKAGKRCLMKKNER